jgi:hypothetical protein
MTNRVLKFYFQKRSNPCCVAADPNKISLCFVAANRKMTKILFAAMQQTTK